MIVTLTWSELMIAHQIAGMIRISAMKASRNQRYNRDNGLAVIEGTEVNAVRAEMAVAKAYNMYWMGGVGNVGSVDVGGIIEVRSVSQANHNLILHPDDKDKFPYVLVDLSDCPNVNLIGWIWGSDGKQDKYWKDPSGKNRPAFFVPQADLNPMYDLTEYVRDNRV